MESLELRALDRVGGGGVVVTIVINTVLTDFLVVLFKGSEIFASLAELTLLHTFADIPVDEGPLGIHEVELVINAGEDFSDSGGVRQHAAGTLDLGKIASGNSSGRLVVNSALEASGAPVNELNAAVGLDFSDGGADVLGDNISAVHHANCHVLSVTGIALGHHSIGLEDGRGELSDGHLFVDCALGGNHGGIRAQQEVDARIGYKIDLEFVDVNIEGTLEAKGSGQRADHLCDQSVEVGVGGLLKTQVIAADVVDGLVVEHKSNVGVFEKRMSGEDGVVGLDDAGGDLRRREDTEVELALLAIIDGESLKEEGTEARASTTAYGVEDEESLKAVAVFSELPDLV